VPRRRNLKKELSSLPNILTMFRILLIPVVLAYIDNESQMRSFIAAALYGATAITDFVDGYLARKWHMESLLGKFLDPLADKLLVMATLVWMVPLGRIETWLVVVLLARELSITGLRSVASSEGLVISARSMGKRKTALQMVGILLLIIHFRYPILFTDQVVDFHQAGLLTIYISLVFSIFSAVEYIQLFARAVQKQAQEAESGVDTGPAPAAVEIGGVESEVDEPEPASVEAASAKPEP
jgi:CDP-diacylglycerol---glycerol-3-phosphate 3-phosphatidyltransferase